MKRALERSAKSSTRARPTHPAAASRKPGAWRKCCAAGPRPSLSEATATHCGAHLRACLLRVSNHLIMPETVAEICEKPEVKQELARATGQRATEKVEAKASHKFIFLPHALLLLSCAIIYYLAGTRLIPLARPEVDL